MRLRKSFFCVLAAISSQGVTDPADPDFRRLVETGVIKPTEIPFVSAPGLPRGQHFKSRAPQGSNAMWQFWYYSRIKGGEYWVRRSLPRSYGPDPNDHGRIFTENEMRDFFQGGCFAILRRVFSSI